MEDIDMFMWGYQPHFQISAKVSADRIFNKLLPGISPRTFLIGIWANDDTHPTTYPICLEPSDCGYEQNLFVDVKKIAYALEARDPEKNLFHSSEKAQENHKKKIKLRSIKNAALSIIQTLDEQHNLISYASHPVNVEGYLVCVILQLNKERVTEVSSLTNGVIHGRYQISTSLLDAVISEFLDGCAKALTEVNPGSGLSISEREEDEIIRSAGNRLMKSISFIMHSSHFNLFEICNMISAERYEGAEGNGKLVFAKRNHNSIKEIITFTSPVDLKNFRAVRKLLELANDELCLLSDTNHIYGLGFIEKYEASNEDLFIIKFRNHFTWELVHDNKLLMTVAYREPQYIKEKINHEKFYSDVQRIFPEIQTHVIDNLWTVITSATEQKHGTMVVISNGAEHEAKRLENQSTRVHPVEITPEIMKLVTSIDGAVLINPEGICYAVGVILDGMATDQGDSSRGARYNSAIRYVKSQNYQCMIIVISEDGYINLIPDLMPQIKREIIDDAISELGILNEGEEIDIKAFNQIMDWFKRHKFYLLENDCEEINQLRKAIELKLKDNIRVVYYDFQPNSEMDQSYYF